MWYANFGIWGLRDLPYQKSIYDLKIQIYCMELIHKDILTGDDLNSYKQIFSVLAKTKETDGLHLSILEYVKNLKDLEFDRFDITAVISDGKVTEISRVKKYGLYFGDEDTPHIIMDQTAKGKIFVISGEPLEETPAVELASLC